MKEKADNPTETSRAHVSRREGLELAAASIMASLLPIPALPSLPGYGFSGKPTAPGWAPVHRGRLVELMKRLGYTRYVAQGGDWGNAVSELMAVKEPPGLLGIHTNMAATVPADVSKALAFHEA